MTLPLDYTRTVGPVDTLVLLGHLYSWRAGSGHGLLSG